MQCPTTKCLLLTTYKEQLTTQQTHTNYNMCLYPKKMINRKYTATKKNGGCVPNPPLIKVEDIYNEWTGEVLHQKYTFDERVMKVEIPCGRCVECLRARARNWTARLIQEIPQTKYNYFVTLTFDPIQLGILMRKTGVGETNPLVGIAIRRMLERWRKTHKKSLKHWFITELGHNGTERIHAHGIIFCNEQLEFKEIQKVTTGGIMAKWEYWKYGHVFVGDYVSTRTVNYLMKYVTKVDEDHKHFIGYIFTSPGIGKTWIDRMQETYKYVPRNSLDYMRLPTGQKIKLPIYYKNKCYSEEERELIWREFMDRPITTIAGNNYQKNLLSIEAEQNITDKAREINHTLGYGDDSQEWKKLPYCITPAMLRKGKNQDQAHAQELAEHLAKMAELRKIRKKMQKNLEISK